MGPFPSSQQGQPPQFQQQGTGRPHGLSHADPIWKRQTVRQPAVQQPPMPPIMPNTIPPSPVTPLSPLLIDPLNPPPPAAIAPRTRSRIVAIILLCLLAAGLYFVWHSSPTSSNTPSITQQNFSSTSTGSSSNSASNTSSTGTIQVYVTGAVKHPGIYTLAQGARVHDLLSVAGGPLPQANLVALNLAAKLSDGQEVYVTVQGETPPNYVGGVPGPGSSSGSATNAGNTGNAGNAACINVNTASADDMRLNLHISSASAQAIINYRVQHGDYQSVQELANVVSKTIYNKIKGTACVS